MRCALRIVELCVKVGLGSRKLIMTLMTTTKIDTTNVLAQKSLQQAVTRDLGSQ